MFGRCTASQMASASLRSFLRVFRYGSRKWLPSPERCVPARSIPAIGNVHRHRPPCRSGGFRVGEKPTHPGPFQLFRTTTSPSKSTPCTRKTGFATSSPITPILLMDAVRAVLVEHLISTMAPGCRFKGVGVHSICKLPFVSMDANRQDCRRPMFIMTVTFVG
jgi:hypothetical protein